MTFQQQEVKQIVEDAIKDVPYAVGINNHMGSLAVENKEIVRAIVEVAKERRLFIIDSATSPNTKFPEVAKELGIPILKRDVFLYSIQKRQLSTASDCRERVFFSAIFYFV
jgi:uncharacterized protein